MMYDVLSSVEYASCFKYSNLLRAIKTCNFPEIMDFFKIDEQH